MTATKVLNYVLLFIVGFGIGIVGTEIYAKVKTPNLTIQSICQPTMDSKDLQNDLYAQANCEYIYGKLLYISEQLRIVKQDIVNVHGDLEKHAGINTPLLP